MKRRALLRMSGATVASVAGVDAVSAEGDTDPRPESQGGTKPSENVPIIETGAIPNENSKLPVGDWIAHNNGWIFFRPNLKLVYEFANSSTQAYIIDGEEFVLDEFEDWNLWFDADGLPHISFEYVTPPKPKGTSYQIKWEFEWDDDPVEEFPNWETVFPLTNDVEVVEQK